MDGLSRLDFFFRHAAAFSRLSEIVLPHSGPFAETGILHPRLESKRVTFILHYGVLSWPYPLLKSIN